MIVITKVTNVSRQVIEDILVTALEGGSNYWYFLPEQSVKAIRAAVPKSVDPYLSTAIGKAILDFGVEVDINDVDNEDEVLGTISIKTLQERLQKLADSSHSWALEREINEDGDADTSDIVMQYMAMGEVIYG
jgi:hypothetical protein